MLEKTIESSLDCKESKEVNPKGNQSRIFIGRTDTEAESPIVWPLLGIADTLENILMQTKNQLIWKDSDAAKIEGKPRRGQQTRDGWMASLTPRT